MIKIASIMEHKQTHIYPGFTRFVAPIYLPTGSPFGMHGMVTINLSNNDAELLIKAFPHVKTEGEHYYHYTFSNND